jgi:hypothetical protein
LAFKKGNPGRPRGTKNKDTSQIHDWLVELGGPNGEHYARRLYELSQGLDPHVAMKALAVITPYVWGKPKEKLEITGADGGSVRIVHEYHDK